MSQIDSIGAVLEKIPYAVAVVTVGRGGVENALTISWMTQVSFEPPMVAFAVDKVHYSEELVRSTKSFVINLLGEDQKKIAGHCAREALTGDDKLAGRETRAAPSGAAILTEALAWIDCDVVAVHPVGDHLLVIGAVEAAGVLREGRPMTTLSSGMRYRKSRPRGRAAVG